MGNFYSAISKTPIPIHVTQPSWLASCTRAHLHCQCKPLSHSGRTLSEAATHFAFRFTTLPSEPRTYFTTHSSPVNHSKYSARKRYTLPQVACTSFSEPLSKCVPVQRALPSNGRMPSHPIACCNIKSRHTTHATWCADVAHVYSEWPHAIASTLHLLQSPLAMTLTTLPGAITNALEYRCFHQHQPTPTRVQV